MKRRLLSTLIGMWMTAVGTSAQAQNIQLSIHDGRVWLSATNATVRQILVEWAQVGQTLVVNGERLPGGPLSIQLDGVPEQQALEVLLRSAGGFMAAARAIPVAHASRFDRVIILPSSTPPRAEAARAAPAAASPRRPAPRTFPAAPATPGIHPVIGADGLPVPDDQDDPAGNPSARPAFSSMPPGFSPPPDDPFPPVPEPASPPSATPTPAAGVAVPGMMVPPPAPPARPRRP